MAGGQHHAGSEGARRQLRRSHQGQCRLQPGLRRPDQEGQGLVLPFGALQELRELRHRHVLRQEPEQPERLGVRTRSRQTRRQPVGLERRPAPPDVAGGGQAQDRRELE